MLKEAPASNVQLYYPGGDYLVSEGTFRMVGLGVDSADIKTDEWTKAYSYVTGTFRSGEKQKRMALRNYQMRIRPFLEDRDEMVMQVQRKAQQGLLYEAAEQPRRTERLY